MRVTVAVSFRVASAWLVAVTVTVAGPANGDGAVYRPLGLFADQVTAVFGSPVTCAVNCCVCPGMRLTVFGLTVTTGPAGGSSVTAAGAQRLAVPWYQQAEMLAVVLLA